MPKVTIVMKWISQYRKPFYDLLKQHMDNNGIELCLVYGSPTHAADRLKKDWVDITWGVYAANHSYSLGSRFILWQPVLNHIKGSDLVIVEHASKLLLNYFLHAMQLFNCIKIAYWGHGRNFQSRNSNTVGERLKQFTLRRADWWFAYTSLCAEEIVQSGFPVEQVTCVENAIDTKGLIHDKISISDIEISGFLYKYQLIGKNVAVYCGGMYEDKRISFLLDAAVYIKSQIHDFELIFIGSGPDVGLVNQACIKFPWIRHLGALFGYEKSIAMKASKLYLMPGLVGLGVLDAFAMGLPVVTTNYPYHSPEIEYVQNNYNGVIADNELSSFSNAIVSLLSNQKKIDLLSRGSHLTAERYTIENMAIKFADGIIKCLNN
jgi:glycosyltransferase involved in cell wall biosynthesis